MPGRVKHDVLAVRRPTWIRDVAFVKQFELAASGFHLQAVIGRTDNRFSIGCDIVLRMSAAHGELKDENKIDRNATHRSPPNPGADFATPGSRHQFNLKTRAWSSGVIKVQYLPSGPNRMSRGMFEITRRFFTSAIAFSKCPLRLS